MSDRHFDQLATRFAEKIYGGAKGAIRLAVLQADLAETLDRSRHGVIRGLEVLNKHNWFPAMTLIVSAGRFVTELSTMIGVPMPSAPSSRASSPWRRRRCAG